MRANGAVGVVRAVREVVSSMEDRTREEGERSSPDRACDFHCALQQARKEDRKPNANTIRSDAETRREQA